MAEASGIDPIETITKIHHAMLFLRRSPNSSTKAVRMTEAAPASLWCRLLALADLFGLARVRPLRSARRTCCLMHPYLAVRPPQLAAQHL